MATKSYTIYSHYDPTQREQLERETGQIPPDGQDVDSAEAWEAEAKLTFKRHLAPPPTFVPASADSVAPLPDLIPRSRFTSDVAGWYRSLTETTNKPSHTSPSPPSSAGSSTQGPPRPTEKRSKNNWFIMNSIATEPAPAAAPPPTLADILARDPPPLPHEPKYSPPVWLALGPANKGFAMLQNSGWNEGEALGPDAARRPIDQTMSDSESSEESDVEPFAEEDNVATSPGHAGEPVRKALITPIATVLKSDRLGIGLKAKTVGPYRASQKRITHNAAAMLAHTKAAEELRQQKKRNGRGHRSFARQRKVEETNRRDLLAYMNQ
ncbi:hypothetical protein DFH07DRAFT_422859 [Mycena maculata]|uniref:G-patch domain-containing protein n=1 Tax=Mycena maculata TaxID=230809 RepID=A0AAD7NIN5_9AGAR|nr:hypothetical protein DFH07DRAFT_422859 [Mycena maculata]